MTRRALAAGSLLLAALAAWCAAPAAWAGTNPYRVAASDVTDAAITVSWVTTTAETGYVIYGTSASSLTSTAYDTRGSSTSDTVHHVVLSGLSASTTYHWKIVSGGTQYGASGGGAFQTATGPSLILVGSRFVTGHVADAGGSAAPGVLVHVTLRDSDASGSSGDSQTRTALTDSSGNWIFSLESFRTQALTSGFTVSTSGDTILVSADGGALGTAGVSADTSSAASSPTSISATLTAPGVPAVTSVSPSQGTNTVANDVTLTGTGFLFATSGALGDAASTALTSFTVVSDTVITARVPSGVAAGSYDVRITAPAGTNSSSAGQFEATAPPDVTETSLPGWTTGRSYSHAIASSGGAAPLSWSVVSGSLPPGLSLSASGVVSGTPSASGTATFTVRVRDNSNVTDDQTLTLDVAAAVTAPSGSLPGWTDGRDYGTRALTTTGGTDPVAWTVTGLPAGLTASGTGRTLTVTGTPTATGTYDVTATATDAAGSSASQTYTIVIASPLTAPGGSLPDWTQGRDYGTRTLTTTGGTDAVTWSTSGLPTGLAASGSARTLTFSGTPTATGTFDIVATAADAAGSTATRTITIVIAAPLTTPTGALPDWTLGRDYGTRTLSTTGGTDTVTWTTSGLPAGLAASGSGRTLTVNGTPTATGTFSVVATATDAAGSTATRTITVVVAASLTTPTGTLPDWTLGRDYGTRTLTTTGGTDAVTWTTSGLPAGLAASASGRTLTITGTPTTTGTYTVVATATDAAGSVATRTITVVIASPMTTPTGTLPDWTLGRDYGTRTLTTTGGTDPVTWTTSGLPAGLVASGSARTLTITGTPTATGTFSVVATATDAAGSVATRTITVVFASPLTTPTGSLPDWTQGRDYGTRTLTTTGGTDAVTWTTSGLPAGLAASGFARTLTITGTPTATGTFDIVAAATDAAGSTATRTITVVIASPLTTPTGALPDWTLGRDYGTRTLTTTGGTDAVTWTTSGVPAGLAATGVGRTLTITGTPTTTGTYTVVATATDAAGSVAARTLTVVIAAPLTTPTGALPDWTLGRDYGTRTLTTSGGTDPVTWTTSGLPAGLVASGSARTLTITGTPTATGTFDVVATATDGAGSVATRTITVVIASPLTTPTGALPDWTLGRDYGTRTLTTTGGTDVVTWTTSGLPTGLVASGSARTLSVSGTPNASGTFDVVATATDGAGSVATRTITVVIASPLTTPTGSLPDWTLGRDYGTRTLTTTGGTDAVTWTTSGVPTGLSASGNGRTLTVTGTPTTTGTYNVVATATDAAGSTATRTITVVIASPLTTPTGSLPDWTQGRDYGTRTLTTTGGTDAVTWSTSGLPAGLTASGNGRTLTVTGTPTTTGTYNVVATATDAAGSVATRTITVVIASPLTTPTGSLPDWTLGRDYGTRTLTTTGGTDAVTWTTSGVPTGLAASGNDRTLTVTGTPTTTGTYNVVATATDAAGSVATRTITVVIASPLTTPTGSLPDWTLGRDYGTRTVTTTGGTGPFTWTVTGLPSGLVATPTARTLAIVGTPNQTGTSSVTLTVTDSAGSSATRTLAVTINAPLTTPSGALPDWTLGRDYGTRTLTTTGGTDAVTWSTSGLPAGLAVSGNGRTLTVTGTPTTTGTYTVVATATDAAGSVAARTLTVVIAAPLTTPTGALPDWTLGRDYGTRTLTTTGGTDAVTWTTSGLPTGLAASGSARTLTITGTPTATGTFDVVATATDAAGSVAARTLTVVIAAPLTTPTGALPDWTLGRGYGTRTLTTTGGTDAVTWTTSGLPAGLTASGNGRTLTVTGTPTTTGTYTVVATATDAAGSTATRTITVVIASPLTTPTGALPDWTLGRDYGTRTITTTGGTDPVTWTTSGLPAGLSASGSGRTLTVTGTPTATGNFDVTMTATDGAGSAASQTYTVVIASPLTTPSGALPDWTQGRDYGTRTLTTTGGTSPFTWTVSGLPAGLLATPNGRTLTVVGTPSQTGTSSVTLTVTDSAGSSATRTLAVTINAPLTTPSGALPDWTLGRDYGTRTLTTSGGIDPVTWTVTGLPAGLVSAATGRTLTITGTPTTAGTSTVTATATDGAGSVATRTITVVIASPLTTPTGALPDWTLGRDYGTRTLTTTGGTDAVTWTTSGVPTGLSASGNGRTLTVTGTPTTTGTYNVVATATDAAGSTATRTITVVIASPLTTPTGSLPDWTQGRDYGTRTLTTTGGTDAVTWTTSGLPAGLAASGSGRTLTVSGTPTTTGTYTVVASATDAAGSVATRTITVVIASPLTTPTGALPDWTLGRDYGTRTLTTTGGTDAVTWTTSGLPAGLAASGTARTLTVTGTPTTTGTYTVVATATDAAGSTAARTITVVIASPMTTPTGSLPDWTQGRDYGTRTVTTTGGTGPFTWTVTGLPSGLVATPTARTLAIVGTPNQTGTSNVSLTVTDAAGSSATLAVSVTIHAPVTTPAGSLPDWTQGRDYGTRTLTTTGGTDPVTWTATGLPPGLSASGTGRTLTVTGVPTTTGAFSVAATATDAAGSTATRTIAVVVNPPLTQPAGNLPDWTIGRDYGTRTITTTGGTDSVTWTVTGLPTGLATSQSGRTLTVTGVPTAAGTFTVAATATDAAGSTAARQFTVVVNPALTAPSGPLPDWTVGRDYGDRSVSVTGGTEPVTWTVSGLPIGLTGTAAGRTYGIAGTPNVAGTYVVLASVTDAAGATSSSAWVVTIHATLSAPAGSIPDWTIGRDYGTRTLTTSGGTDPVLWNVTGLPPGLSGSASGRTYTITGTPTRTGTYTVSATVTDYAGAAASKDTVVVVAGPVTVVETSLPAWTVARPYSQTLHAAGGTAPLRWELVAGGVPGLSFDGASATLWGVPSIPGDFPVAFRVTDAAGSSDERQFTVVVNTSIALTADALSFAAERSPYADRVAWTGGTSPVTVSVASAPGTVPSWLTIDAATGALSGTPDAAGVHDFDVTVTDSAGATATRSYRLEVAALLAIDDGVGQPLRTQPGQTRLLIAFDVLRGSSLKLKLQRLDKAALPYTARLVRTDGTDFPLAKPMKLAAAKRSLTISVPAVSTTDRYFVSLEGLIGDPVDLVATPKVKYQRLFRGVLPLAAAARGDIGFASPAGADVLVKLKDGRGVRFVRFTHVESSEATALDVPGPKLKLESLARWGEFLVECDAGEGAPAVLRYEVTVKPK